MIAAVTVVIEPNRDQYSLADEPNSHRKAVGTDKDPPRPGRRRRSLPRPGPEPESYAICSPELRARHAVPACTRPKRECIVESLVHLARLDRPDYTQVPPRPTPHHGKCESFSANQPITKLGKLSSCCRSHPSSKRNGTKTSVEQNRDRAQRLESHGEDLADRRKRSRQKSDPWEDGLEVDTFEHVADPEETP